LLLTEADSSSRVQALLRTSTSLTTLTKSSTAKMSSSTRLSKPSNSRLKITNTNHRLFLHGPTRALKNSQDEILQLRIVQLTPIFYCTRSCQFWQLLFFLHTKFPLGFKSHLESLDIHTWTREGFHRKVLQALACNYLYCQFYL